MKCQMTYVRSHFLMREDSKTFFDVRFGSKADMCSAKRDVRFTPKSGHGRHKANVSWAISEGGRFTAQAMGSIRF